MIDKIKEATTIAAFDFDGTLTERDTLLPFLWSSLGKWTTAMGLLRAAPCCLALVLTFSERQRIKEALLTQCLGGINAMELENKGRIFAQEMLAHYLKPASIERLHWHQAQGHSCILVSANLSIYLTPWALRMGFDAAICSELAVNNQGIITGKLLGANCWGQEKTRRLFALLERPRNSYTLYAYGDSRGDRELLSTADYAYYRFMPSVR